MTQSHVQFDRVDMQQLRLIVDLPPHRRVRLMLEAREFAIAMIRARIRQQYPGIADRDLNLKLITELSRVDTSSRTPREFLHFAR